MLVLVRLYPKGGLDSLGKLLESEKRNLYWEDIRPLYAIRQEGKKFLSIVLDVKNVDAIQKVFLKNLETMTSVRKSITIPIMSPVYFPLPEGHEKDLSRFMLFLRIEPGKYDEVYTKLLSDMKYPDGVNVTYLSYSFGDDDLILSILAKDRENALKFAENTISKIDGVLAHDTSKVVERIPLLPEDKLKTHVGRFMYSVPAGQKGAMANPEAYAKYVNEKAPMSVIIRLFSKKNLPKLWEDVEKNVPAMESKNFTAYYASQQDAKDYITVISEATNFEVLRTMVVKDLPTLVDSRKTRTIPMMNPTYFLMPKEHPRNLERFLISLRVMPGDIQTIRSKIIAYDFPDNVFLTYLTFTLGEDDILLSILSDSQKSAQEFAKKAFDKMDGIVSYDISNQLKTMRLTTTKKWKNHQGRFLSSYDKQHKKDFDSRFDWTDDFDTYAAMTGAFTHELE